MNCSHCSPTVVCATIFLDLSFAIYFTRYEVCNEVLVQLIKTHGCETRQKHEEKHLSTQQFPLEYVQQMRPPGIDAKRHDQGGKHKD